MRCLHKRNSAAGFVGQHKRSCGRHGCDATATHHVAVGSHYCANLCNQHTKYYRTRNDTEVTDQLVIAREENNEHKAKLGK